jgi:modification methylase
MKTMASRRTQPKVPFGTLIETGMIQPGTLLTDSKRRWQARVLADGSLSWGSSQGSIHKIGAEVQNAPSCNGWTFWHVDEEGVLQPLDAFRQRHILTWEA